MPKRTGDFDAWLLNELSDPKAAASYVNAAVRDDPDMLPVVLGRVAKAHKMKTIAKEAGLARESLYNILSESGNPTLKNLNAVLKAVGLRIEIVPEREECTAPEEPPPSELQVVVGSGAPRHDQAVETLPSVLL